MTRIRPCPVRWGFLGAGMVATTAMAPAVHVADGAVLQVAAARDPQRARALGPMRATDSYESVLADEDVDAVYVALPNAAHRPWVLAALAAGKHVLCEKPLALDAPEAREMAAAAQRAGLLLVEAAWNRWHPRTRRIQELATTLEGGCEVSAWFAFPGPAPGSYRLDPACGGGALLDVGCYAVGLAAAVLGERTRVASATQRRGPSGVDLTTTARLRGDRGVAIVTASFESAESQGFQVRSPAIEGRAQATVLELPDQAFTSWRERSILRVTRDGASQDEQFGPCDAYRLMVEAVSARVRGDDDAWVLPLSDSIAVAALLDDVSAAARAARGSFDERSAP